MPEPAGIRGDVVAEVAHEREARFVPGEPGLPIVRLLGSHECALVAERNEGGRHLDVRQRRSDKPRASVYRLLLQGLNKVGEGHIP
jgi:hypothetical protein